MLMLCIALFYDHKQGPGTSGEFHRDKSVQGGCLSESGVFRY